MEPGRGGARQPPWKNPRDLDQPVPSLCHPQQRARESSPGGPLFWSWRGWIRLCPVLSLF